MEYKNYDGNLGIPRSLFSSPTTLLLSPSTSHRVNALPSFDLEQLQWGQLFESLVSPWFFVDRVSAPYTNHRHFHIATLACHTRK